MPQLHQAGHCRLVLLLADLFQGQLGMAKRSIVQSFMEKIGLTRTISQTTHKAVHKRAGGTL